jgi:hypothetical protein
MGCIVLIVLILIPILASVKVISRKTGIPRRYVLLYPLGWILGFYIFGYFTGLIFPVIIHLIIKGVVFIYSWSLTVLSED